MPIYIYIYIYIQSKDNRTKLMFNVVLVQVYEDSLKFNDLITCPYSDCHVTIFCSVCFYANRQTADNSVQTRSARRWVFANSSFISSLTLVIVSLMDEERKNLTI